MELLGTVVALGLGAAVGALGPTGLTFELLYDTSEQLPGTNGPVYLDGVAAEPCGGGVVFRAYEDEVGTGTSWAYYVDASHAEVVVDGSTVLPGVSAVAVGLEDIRCTGTGVVSFIAEGAGGPIGVFRWTPGGTLELLQSGNVLVSGHQVGDIIDLGGNEQGVGLQARLLPSFSGEAVLYKPNDGELAYVADDVTAILPGQTEPPTSLSSPRAFDSGMIFRARSGLQDWLYRWQPGGGIAPWVDHTTPGPDGVPLPGVGGFTVLRRGVAFSSVDSAGIGIFLVDRQGTIQRLVTPGQKTATGETLIEAWGPSGRDELIAFRGRVAEIDFFQSVFARTPDGVIHRLVGHNDTIDGETVILAFAAADEDEVALRIETEEAEVVREYVYRVRCAGVTEIPTVAPIGLAALVILLLATAMWRLARSPSRVR